MRIRTFFPVLAGAIFISCSHGFSGDVQVEEALRSLDKVMENQDEIAAKKTARIDSLKFMPSVAADASSLYDAYDALFREYHKWNLDSAYVYADRKAELAAEIGSEDLICDAALDLAGQHLISTLYSEAISTLESLDPETVVSCGRLPEYLYLWYDIYHGMVEITKSESLCRVYREKEQYYLDLCRQHITDDCILYYNTQAKVMISQGRCEEFIALVRRKIDAGQASIEDLARLHYWEGRAYQAMGDKRNALINFAIGARYDFTIPVRTYGSLIVLTGICHETGDIQRAYRYATRAYIDSVDMNDSMRVNRIADLFPDIIVQYEQYAAAKRRQIALFIIALLMLLAALSFALVLLRRNLSRLHRANEEIVNNARRLEESNRIKDTYLGEFMSLFSEHINSLEKYRSSLRVAAKQNDFEVLLQELRSEDFIDSEWEYLYDKFDKTFLGLFPDFVKGLNALLREDRQIGAGLREGELTNELRVFALMRLGVTEPSRISKFLRLSSTTVYNYRVKLRNSAICPRDEFETNLMHIGE